MVKKPHEPQNAGSSYATMTPESTFEMRPPIKPRLPRPKRLPWARTPPAEMLPGEYENVGTGAHGIFSLMTMTTRTPSPCGSQYTLTSAKRPAVCSRSRAMSRVLGPKVSPMETPAMERTVSSSVRVAPLTLTSVIASSCASALAEPSSSKSGRARAKRCMT